MPTVAALVGSAASRAEVERLLGRTAVVRTCDRAYALAALVRASGARVVVAEPHDRTGASVVSALAALWQAVPAVHVLLWFPLTNAGARDVLALARAGVDFTPVVRGADDLARAVAAVLEHPSAPRPETALLERMAPAVPPPLRAFCTLCAVRASPAFDVAAAATALHTPRRTLEGRLRRAGLPPARRIVRWCCVLHAVWQLDVQERMAKQVVAEMGFASPAALANLVRRYCNCAPSRVRECGGFPAMLDRFARELVSGRRRVP